MVNVITYEGIIEGNTTLGKTMCHVFNVYSRKCNDLNLVITLQFYFFIFSYVYIVRWLRWFYKHSKLIPSKIFNFKLYIILFRRLTKEIFLFLFYFVVTILQYTYRSKGELRSFRSLIHDVVFPSGSGIIRLLFLPHSSAYCTLIWYLILMMCVIKLNNGNFHFRGT